MNWRRALLVWLAIAVAESVHGIIRRVFVLPAIGELPAHQVGMLVGCLIIFAIACASIRWIGARSTSELLTVVAVWMVLMAAFEVSLGYAFGYPLSRILQDYDLPVDEHNPLSPPIGASTRFRDQPCAACCAIDDEQTAVVLASGQNLPAIW